MAHVALPANESIYLCLTSSSIPEGVQRLTHSKAGRSGPSSKARVEEVTAPSLKASVKVAATAAPSSKARVEVEPVASWLKASVVVVAEAAPSLKARDMPGLYYCNAIRFTTSPVEVAITPFCFAFSPSTVTVNH